MATPRAPQYEMSRLQTLLAELTHLALPQEPLTEFSIFPKLPIELRREIWKYASFEPRIIKLFDDPRCSKTRRVEGQSRTPALLHVSKEARSEGLRHYKLCWERSPFGGNAIKSSMYLNFDVDRFRHHTIGIFPFRRVSTYNFDRKDLKQIKFLDFEHNHLDFGMLSSVCFSAGVSYVIQLKEITFMFTNWHEYQPTRPNSQEALCPVGLDLLRQKIKTDTLEHIRNGLEGWNKLSCAFKFNFIVVNDDLDAAPCQADRKPQSYFDTMSLGYGPTWDDWGVFWGDPGCHELRMEQQGY